MTEKRRTRRISAELPVSVYLFDKKNEIRISGALQGLVQNFSPYGAGLTIDTILLDGRHIFYTCHDKPDMVLELVFDQVGRVSGPIAVQAEPVWFDRDQTVEKKQFAVGLKFLTPASSREMKDLSSEVCCDEKMLVALWKKIF